MPNTVSSFEDLKQKVIEQLRKHHYKESTITNYSRIYNRIGRFMDHKGYEIYTEEVGVRFLDSLEHKDNCICPVRRLNDYISDMPYRCHYSQKHTTVPKPLDSILEDYINHCKSKGNAPNTISLKEIVCARFLNLLCDMGCSDLISLNATMVAKALLTFSNKDKYAIVRSFLNYLYKEGLLTSDLSMLVPRFKRRLPIPTVYSIPEMMKIESSIDLGTRKGIRDIAMLRLATRMGMRAGDIANLKWEEIDFSSRTITKVQDKTRQVLSLKLPDDVYDVLCLNRNAVMNDPIQDEYVFHSLSAPYEKVTSSIIRHAVNEYMEKANIDVNGRKHGPHAFRSSMATSMINSGAGYETVRKILGHSNPNVIKHYAKTDIERLRNCSINPPDPVGNFADFLSGKKV